MTRLLVVEDSPTQARELTILLEIEGFEVELARDGEKGLQQCYASNYDAVLSDVVMPGMDGYEMCRRIKADPKTRHLPVILLTSLSDPLDIIRGLECGADNFITKPYEARYLVTRLRHLLDNKGLRAAQKVSVGVELLLMGKRFTINSEKEQMLDLLISTFEEVLRSRNREYEARLSEEAARQSRRTLGLLLEVGELLGGTLDHEAALRDLAVLLARRMADGCLIRSLEDDDAADGKSPGRPGMMAAATADPSKQPWAEKLVDLGPPAPTADALHAFVQAGKVAMAEKVTPADLETFAPDGDQLEALRALDPKSAMVIPLLGRSRPLAVVWMYTAGTRAPFEARDLALAEDLARRASLALDNTRLYREAQDAIKVRDDFMAVASHELKTPLTALTLTVQGLVRAQDLAARESLSDRIVSQLRALDRHARRVGRLIGTLLDVSRIAEGDLPLDIQRVDLRALLTDILATFAGPAAQAGCKLELTAETEGYGQWDPTRLEQVVQNLLSNAIKFGAGAPVDVVLTGSADEVRLVVRDRGIGVDPVHQKRIFGRFERAVSTRHYGGFGLGLWISRRAVQAMGGTITVASAPAKGATFTVVLPRFPS
jgi:signal transduction histidine kinase/DNA-binding response OmpR family regulator